LIWKSKYKQALVEVDPTRLLQMIEQVQAAMATRSKSPEVQSSTELQEINDASYTLQILKTQTLAAEI